MADAAPRGPWRRRDPSAPRRSQTGRPPLGRYALKLLTPQPLAAAVIGRGGSNIFEIEQSSQAHVGVSRVNELFHSSECRILAASAESVDALQVVARRVLDLVQEVNDRTQTLEGCEDDRLRISMLVPRAVVTDVLADGGSGMRAIVAASGAFCRISDPLDPGGPEATQEVKLRGSLEELEVALNQFICKVQLQADEPWFPGWAHPTTGLTRVQESSAPHEHEQRPLDTSHPAVLKVLVPRSLAKAFTPAALSEIRQQAQAQLLLSQPSETFPQTHSRILTARAEAQEALDAVGEWLVGRLAEAAEADPFDDAVVWEGNLKISCIIPKASSPVLIGRGGSAIRHLCASSGAQVQVIRDSVVGPGPDGHQKVDIRGSASSVEHVLREIVTVTFSVHEEAWFNTWASASMVRPQSASKRASSCPAAEVGMDLVGRVMEGLPPYVLEESRGFAMNCVVPGRLVGAVIGRNGSGVNKVMSTTKTKIAMRELPGDTGDWSMNIAGPLLNTCSAYMLMMQRYLDAEKEVLSGKG